MLLYRYEKDIKYANFNNSYHVLFIVYLQR